MANKSGPKSDKLWSDAVRLAVMRDQECPDGKKRRRLSIIADNLCKAAIQGDMVAIKEIGDRLDGKPRQQQDIKGPGEGGALEVIHKITREVVAPKNSNG